MIKESVFCGIVVLAVLCRPVKPNESNVEIDKSRGSVITDRRFLLHYTRAEEGLVKETKNSSLVREIPTDKKKHRRVRKKKEKGGKVGRSKNKPQKPVDYVDEQVQRNNEKLHLVRNRTIEILKNGLRILSAGEIQTQSEKKQSPRVNETLLEKILSSAASRHDILSTTSGMYRVPVGGKTFEPKLLLQVEDKVMPENRTRASSQSLERDDSHLPQTQAQSANAKDYDYEEYGSTLEFKSNDLNKSFEDYESVSFDRNVGTMLERIVDALKNITMSPNNSCSSRESRKDPCLKWLECKESLTRAFIGESGYLPSCPCTYPSTIFYDDAIRDEKQKKYFRWRDASSEAERLDIYKPGAAYCIRSLVTRGSSSVSSQQCCYDRKLWLLTRGSGAGTVNFVSPDISKKLHYIADILPWRLCKGDFTRYNEARIPNNGNGCRENPEEKQYQLQVESSKNF